MSTPYRAQLSKSFVVNNKRSMLVGLTFSLLEKTREKNPLIETPLCGLCNLLTRCHGLINYLLWSRRFNVELSGLLLLTELCWMCHVKQTPGCVTHKSEVLPAIWIHAGGVASAWCILSSAGLTRGRAQLPTSNGQEEESFLIQYCVSRIVYLCLVPLLI